MSSAQYKREKTPRAEDRGWRWMGEQIAGWVGERRLKPSELIALAMRGFAGLGLIAYKDDITNALAEVDGSLLRYSKGEWYAVPACR